ncbi:MAG TPA: hypothetical protein P5268_01430 [Candidatus Marinimicrobia bacterium]|nr:hypothetical protein [Candidatus Neomarinimicrobiota bacterium]HRS50983.1 hypothetical protein [Candidatus Neomarinimicrobiota bacterium]HRU91675.1 hypothetical protein [Candidatus Neomarinimicrobiota bacterium]
MRLIHRILVGKSHYLFPTFFLTVSLCNTLFASNWQVSIYNLLGFPEIPTVTLTDLNSPRLMKARTGYDDIYRKIINQETTLTLSEQTNVVQFNWPFHLGQTSQLIKIGAERNFSNFNNLDDNASLVSRCQIAHTNFSTLWAMAYKRIQFGCGLDFNWNSAPFLINITSFPHSDDELTNKYFFDLLEPTFGQELTNTLNIDQTGYSLWASLPLNNKYSLGLAIRATEFDFHWRILYINSGEKAALAGQRQIDLPINGLNYYYRLFLNSGQSLMKDVSVMFFSNDFDYFIDNNRPHFTDLDTLGLGYIDRDGYAIQFTLGKRLFETSGGLSYSNYKSDIFLSTPVLGFQWGIAPIFHSADLKFSYGHSFSQQIGFGTNFNWQNVNFQVGALYSHTLFDFWLKGKANLMMGIKSDPLDYPYKYSLHLFNLNAEAEWRRGPLGVAYTFRQLIPTGRRMDDSPIRFYKETPGVEYTYRGGQQHRLNFTYYF